MQSRAKPIIGQTVDHEGRTWDVTEVRPTVHGFDLLLGWPEDLDRGLGRGRSRVILTTELVELITSSDKSQDIDLPAEVQHIRKRLGLTKPNKPHLSRPVQWWLERMRDMLSLTTTDFAAKHGVSNAYVCKWRKNLTGMTAKEGNAVRKGLRHAGNPTDAQ